MRLFVVLGISAILSFIAGICILTYANPEVTFWHGIMQRRDADLQKIQKENSSKPIIVFAGGSSCAFSIQPAVIEEITGLPAVNYGEAATSGSKYLINSAMIRCRSGDILVLALEPHFLTEDGRNDPTQLGLALALTNGDLSLATGTETFGDTISLPQIIHTFRPGARYTATWIGKSLKGDLGYRYKPGDYNDGGWLQTDKSPTTLQGTRNPNPARLSDEGVKILRSTVFAASRREIQVFYSLPWIFTDPAILTQAQKNHRILLNEISTYLPVIEDPALGAKTSRVVFSDSSYHLSRKGSRMRSEIVATALKNALKSN